MSREPVAVRGAIVAAVTAVINVLVLLGWWDLDPEQQAAIITAVTALGTVVYVVLTRSQVTPVDSPRDRDGHPLEPIDEEPIDYVSDDDVADVHELPGE